MAGNFDGIKKQRFGIEIELTGITRAEAAEAIAELFDSDYDHYGGSYDRYDIADAKGRTWKIVYDSSIHKVNHNHHPTSNSHYAVEMVTPILEYEDIPQLQEVVRALRKAGGITGAEYGCGIHIHIDGAPYDARKLRNLVNIFASKEDMLYQALQVAPSREYSYCKKIDPHFLEQLNRRKPKTMEEIKHLWYGDTDHNHPHYHPSRYRNLNLHSLFTNNNFEIRSANSTLHAGVIRAYICLALAVSNQALTQKSASPRVTQSSNPKYTFRTWLIRIGLNGEEFKNVRKHLLSHLEGNIAWKNPEDAIAQRERLNQERIAAREQAVAAVSQVTEEHEDVPELQQEALSGDSEEDMDEEELSFGMSY